MTLTVKQDLLTEHTEKKLKMIVCGRSVMIYHQRVRVIIAINCVRR